MTLRKLCAAAMLLGVAACTRPQPQNDASPPPAAPQPPTPPAAPVPPQPPAPPKAPVDPKSTAAAVKLVQGFADLLNQRKFDQAYMLLGPNALRRADFERRFSAYQDLRVQVGAAGDQDGAAGSIYLSVPLRISGTQNGKSQSSSATAIVRRVNDVPGSTEAQRRWHIERIDWSDAG